MIELNVEAVTCGAVVVAGTSTADRWFRCSASTTALTAAACWIALPWTSGITTGRSDLSTTFASETVRSKRVARLLT